MKLKIYCLLEWLRDRKDRERSKNREEYFGVPSDSLQSN